MFTANFSKQVRQHCLDLAEVICERDNLDFEEFCDQMSDYCADVLDESLDPEDMLMYHFGIEPDYLIGVLALLFELDPNHVY